MKKLKYILLAALVVVISGFLLPQQLIIPVQGANEKDWHPDSFWHYPWGKSVTHKGIDIFSKKGTPVISSCSGIVWYTGEVKRGGKIVVVLGPKWRFHYYAHLNEISVKTATWVSKGQALGTVGNTGNAVRKPSHLHYAIVALFPHFWRVDKSIQGGMKMFYLDPGKEFQKEHWD